MASSSNEARTAESEVRGSIPKRNMSNFEALKTDALSIGCPHKKKPRP
ncbi:hypothetical protein AKJ09_06957 [Labilithrix luteola]|uniref:Uncharacterized protein n=1 Tax=Labilithrix luteola TaxID=1391654 RepID=A0A0K1Q3F2_9BACT|nr:hypothetical protein AKJ09_06957 [Labilithrix luteola]